MHHFLDVATIISTLKTGQRSGSRCPGTAVPGHPQTQPWLNTETEILLSLARWISNYRRPAVGSCHYFDLICQIGVISFMINVIINPEIPETNITKNTNTRLSKLALSQQARMYNEQIKSNSSTQGPHLQTFMAPLTHPGLGLHIWVTQYGTWYRLRDTYRQHQLSIVQAILPKPGQEELNFYIGV